MEQYIGEEVKIHGWLYNVRSSGSIVFLQVRDGTGLIQAVVVEDEVNSKTFQNANDATQESSLTVTGKVRADERAPTGCELAVTGLQLLQRAEEDYPITLKEHGVDFLLENRHFWLRTPKQVAIMRIRDTVFRACQDFLGERGFVRIDTPILTPTSCEGTSTLFETEYFDSKAYLAQSGQLYAEAAAMALGRVYCFGPTFRAEKSKTPRHLMEFWMIEPEMAFYDHEDNMKLQEEMVSAIIERVLEENRNHLEELERDLSHLEIVEPPFPRITYEEALDILAEGELPLEFGEDFGAPHETLIAQEFEKPVFVEKYPTEIKAFYMEPDPDRPELALCDDLLAPEGYGEIIGGSQRIHDYDLIVKRIEEHDLPREAFEWYIDLRRYGSVVHSGFGLGLERLISWITGCEHVREAIPFPRLLNRIYP